MIDRRRHIGDGEQAPLLAHLDGDGLGADAVENLLADSVSGTFGVTSSTSAAV